ncbi:hypothetical protein G6F55_013644 [Rhizopus delemar]|nr:hypothetical protein G6F55_013644 [Rhizopus delemar]KAG1490787.1 hypothetical protein G6F52_013565 [Rhizopus delemar]KAG1530157.1 hypothetical protein G6F51_013928 [Rhizopus arrhizus]KAG1535047.1 hypothetical protein G6F50_015403 [Rhizopus delemar]KAG1608318.1 hypothetical protein G6F45_013608 [Rhizopus arrhizus]
MEFLSKLRQGYPYGIGYAIQHKEEGNSLSVELGLASQDYCNDAINKPIIIKDISFPATRTFPTSLTRFNFSDVPMESPMETKDTLLKIFSRYGKVIDIVVV